MNPSEHIDARRVALWLLYAIDVTDGDVDEALELARDTAAEQADDLGGYFDLVAQKVRGVRGRIDDVDDVVQSVSPRWKIERMAYVDRNILRLGAWEILYGDVPPLAVINGCVDLAKEYGAKTTPGFVNGLLDQICKDRDIAVTGAT